MMKKLKKHYTREKLAELLKVKESTILYYVKKGAPQSIRFKGYPLEEFLQWIIERPQTRKAKTNIHAKAEKILKMLGTKTKKAPKKSTSEDKNNSTTEVAEECKKIYRKGLTPALGRVRQAEIEAYEQYRKKLSQNKPTAGALKTWQSTLDVLRKCENDFLSVLEARKELIPYNRYLAELQPMLGKIKLILMNIPSKLAPRLEGLPWHEIQKILESEIRDVLENIPK